MKALLTASIALLLSTTAYAVEPVGSDTFNTDPGFDLSTLTAENFYDVIVPLAKKEGSVTLYDFTDSFGPLFTEHLIPEFETKYGITVSYIRGEGAAANQQLIAAHNAGAKAPADAYFVSSGGIPLLLGAGVMSNVPLNQVLPAGPGINAEIATSTSGIQHGGAFLPFHRNQTAIVYDTRAIPADQVPADLDTLATWAKANPGKFIVTSPAGGGSGDGFMQAIAFAKVTGADCTAAFTKWDITAEEATAIAGADCMKPLWDYYADILPSVEVTNGNSDTLNLIANGAGSIGTAWEDMVYDFTGRGLLPPTVRLELLSEGMVGGGDGLFFPVNGEHPASGLLMLDFLMSHDVQLEKLSLNGSRSARTDIDPAASFTPEQVARLIPTEQYATRAKLRMPAILNDGLKAHFVANILAKK
ncbi:putative spermidine/putrescine transport system substrate-binding protein [Devosia sp. UYZn731]|uniref:extracellular solute-binding protein n=1 Tax=Devosia sp. UYZn731 TaxID=3156345 RepID=UPI0033919933